MRTTSNDPACLESFDVNLHDIYLLIKLYESNFYESNFSGVGWRQTISKQTDSVCPREYYRLMKCAARWGRIFTTGLTIMGSQGTCASRIDFTFAKTVTKKGSIIGHRIDSIPKCPSWSVSHLHKVREPLGQSNQKGPLKGYLG